MADHQQQYSSSRSTSGTIQAPDNDALISVGENREHLSLLSSSRRQLGQSIRVNLLTAGPAPTSSQDDNYAASSSLSVSLPMRHRMINYYRLIFNRHPRGTGVFLVFILYFLETFAFNSALNGIEHLLPNTESSSNENGSTSSPDIRSFVFSLLYSSAGRVFYPVAGVIADSYLGRYNMIHIGLWLLWVGFAISSFSFSYLFSSNGAKYTVVAITFILFGAGSGSVEATLIPFGVDQLSQGASSDELSSYFYYYYIARNAAGMIATLIFVVDFDLIHFYPQSDLNNPRTSNVKLLDNDLQYTLQSVLALIALSIALLILLCMKSRFYHDRQHSNAPKLIFKVLSYATTVKRQIPQYNRAFRYGEGKMPRIELAKREYDGIFSSEEVEDVKTCYRMLFLLLSLFGYFVTYGAGFAYLTTQLSRAATVINAHNQLYLTSNVIWIINTGTILIILPFTNHIIIPFWPTVNMKVKLGVGFSLHVLSFGVAGFIQWSKTDIGLLTEQQFFYWMLLPTIFLSAAEAIVFVSGLEFIYAQSPNNMKGLQIGMFYLIYGIFSGIGSTLYFGVNICNHNGNLTPVLCLILFVIGIIGLVVYVITACRYKNRQRPTADGSEYDAQRRIMYEDVIFDSTG